MAFTTYTVQPGQTNFKPAEPIWPVFGVHGFKLKAKILPGGWCSREEWDGDGDWSDWWKLAGITYWLSRNNKRSAMIALRFGVEPETWDIAAYTNDKQHARGWAASAPLIINSGELLQAECNLIGNCAQYGVIGEQSHSIHVGHGIKGFSTVRRIGTYAGGNNNSPGPFGGEATKPLSIEIDFQFLK